MRRTSIQLNYLLGTNLPSEMLFLLRYIEFSLRQDHVISPGTVVCWGMVAGGIIVRFCGRGKRFYLP